MVMSTGCSGSGVKQVDGSGWRSAGWGVHALVYASWLTEELDEIDVTLQTAELMDWAVAPLESARPAKQAMAMYLELKEFIIVLHSMATITLE